MTEGSIPAGGELSREGSCCCASLLGDGHDSGDNAVDVVVAGDKVPAVDEENDVAREEDGVSSLI